MTSQCDFLLKIENQCESTELSSVTSRVDKFLQRIKNYTPGAYAMVNVSSANGAAIVNAFSNAFY